MQSDDKFHDEYIKSLRDNIYTCMEFSRQSYGEVIAMPIKRFYDYLKWKVDLEDKKRAEMEESTNFGKDLKLPKMNFKK